MKFNFNDGGRSENFKGKTNDCVVRSIAIAAELPYKQVYDDLFKVSQKSPRNGVNRKVYQKYLEGLGFRWIPTMKIGQGCKTHLVDGELPTKGRLIVRLSKHLTTVIDGIIHDTYDPQRATIFIEGGISRIAHRCVYGYFIR